jgi:predicted flap endonuclease-1-like 5' DNA nuclease
MYEWIWVIIGLLVILLFYVLYSQSRPKRNKSTPNMAETKPESTAMESPKETVPVELIPEVETKSSLIESSKKDDVVTLAPEVVTQSVIKESNEREEPVDLIHEVVPKSAMIEDSTAEPVNSSLEAVSQNIKIEKPIKPESSQILDSPIKQAENRRESKKPAPKTRDHGSKITDLEGIGSTYAEKLNSIGIITTSDLLESGATPRGRKELAEKTDISHNLILEWVNLSDLLRVKGIGEEYSDLLEEAGVDTVVELSHRNAVNLHAHVLEVNLAKKLVRRTPSLSMVERWISEAKDLPRKIEY